MNFSKPDGGPLTLWLDEDTDKQLQDQLKGLDNFYASEIIKRYVDPETNRPYAHFTFSCKALQDNGRCGIYETRPELCRTYEPSSDNLCVHFTARESGDPTIGIDLHVIE